MGNQQADSTRQGMELVRKYRNLKNEIAQKEDALREIIAQKNDLYERSLAPVQTDRELGRTYAKRDPVLATVAAINDVYGQRINSLLCSLSLLYARADTLKSRIDTAGLSQKEEQYVRLRYIEGMSATDTAQRLGFCERHCRSINHSALSKIAHSG